MASCDTVSLSHQTVTDLIPRVVTLAKRVVVTDTYSALLPNLQLSLSEEAFRILGLAMQYGKERRI
jgi:hypothetical protein